MSRVKSLQTGQTAPQPCPVNMSWNLHQILKKSIPDTQQSGFNLFQVKKLPTDPPQLRAPIPDTPHPRPNPRAHPYNGYHMRKQTHPLNQAQLSPRAVDSPQTSLGLGPASVAAPKPAPRTSAGKRTCIASSISNQRRNKGAAGASGIEVQDPLRSLPYPFAPSHQAMPPPPFQVPSSYLAHRSRRTHHRDDGPIDIDSRLRLLAPQEGKFGRRNLYAQQRVLDEKLKRIKAAGEALARRDTGASAIVPSINVVGDVSTPQRSLTTGAASSGASYASWTGSRKFNTTAFDSTSSERQHRRGFIPAQVSGTRYEHHQPRMASPNRPVGQDPDPRGVQSMNGKNVSAPVSPFHNARAPVEVDIRPPSVQPVPRRHAHAHAAADRRVVAATSLSTSQGDHTSPVYHRKAGFDEQKDVIRTDTLAGSPAPAAESATVWVDIGCDRLRDIPGADAWAAESFAGPDGAMLCDTPVVNIG
ncbi:hypothetical protein TRAPUB_6913, partial [Trametes pubescens]